MFVLSQRKYFNKSEVFIITIGIQIPFQKVWIPGPFCKLCQCGITGNVFLLIKNIYEKSQVLIETDTLQWIGSSR